MLLYSNWQSISGGGGNFKYDRDNQTALVYSQKIYQEEYTILGTFVQTFLKTFKKWINVDKRWEAVSFF